MPLQHILQGLAMEKQRPKRRFSTLSWLIMAIPAFPVSLWAFYFMFGTLPGNPERKNRILSSVSGYLHITGGAIAMLLGPVQFLGSVRRKYSWVHRWVGRVYAAAIFVSGFSGFPVAMQSNAYSIGDYGFALLALIWLITMFMGVVTIWNGDVPGHREWMIRNFSLTYAAVMLRWQLFVLFFFGLGPPAALTVTAFSCWIPNLIFAEWYIGIRTRKNRKVAVQ